MKRLSLTSLILIGLGLGVLTGLLVGERAAALEPVGNAFIRLLQMAVLPYFIVALPLGFGRLSYAEAKAVGLRIIKFSALLWLLTIGLVTIFPLTFPPLQSAAFFSSSITDPGEKVDFVGLYIPANPFETLAEAVIPGVVVFGISLGVALIGVPGKGRLLEILDILADSLGRITGFVVRLTPVGVFALAASAAGSMTLEDLSRLQVYLVAYTVGAVLLAFWLVPMLVSALTPLSYRDVLRATRDPLVTGFTTGNLLVVLAMLAENCKALFARLEDNQRRHAESVVDVSLPITFTFPNVGVVLLLLFIPFAGWYTGNPIAIEDYPRMAFLGFFSFFGSVEIGLPFLLQQLRIPTDMFQLHVVTLVYVGRLATLLAVMNLAVIAILTAAGNCGFLRWQPRRFAVYGGISLSLVLVSVMGTRMLLGMSVDQAYDKDDIVRGMSPILGPVSGTVFREEAAPLPRSEGATPLESIRERGVLKVGYDPGGLPFCFFNEQDELVGFDIEMIEAFAREMGIKVEYYPYRKGAMAEVLGSERSLDLLVGGLFATPRRVESMRFSDSYLDLDLALIVPDHRSREFKDLEPLERERLRIGVLERPYFGSRVREKLPRAEIVQVDSARDFFEGAMELDALVMSAQAGSAWTLLHPGFDVVIPTNTRLKVSIGYPMCLDALRLENVISRWLDLKRNDGTIDRLYRHWIEGRSAGDSGPRWNILDDVLGFADDGQVPELIQNDATPTR